MCQEQLSLDRPVLPLLHLSPSKSSTSSGSKREFHEAFDPRFVLILQIYANIFFDACCQCLYFFVFVQVTTATLGFFGTLDASEVAHGCT